MNRNILTETQKGGRMESLHNQYTTLWEGQIMPLYVNCTTGEIACQDDIALEDGKRDWGKRKRMSIQVSKLMATYDPERAELIRQCGTYLEFVKVPDGSRKLHKANFCRQRLCPMCQWRRSIKLRAQADQIYKVIEERGYKHIFVTLTIRNCTGPELKQTTDELIQAAQRFKRTEIYKRVVRGAYRALEITYNSEADTYHPHLHYLLTVDGSYFQKENQDYITHGMLQAAWKKTAHLDYEPLVSIEGIKQKSGQTMTAACAEICKYPAKSAEVHQSSVLQYIDYALRGRRLIQWTGIAADVRRELDLDDVETGNLIQTIETAGDVELEKVVYIWRYGFYMPLDYKMIKEKAG